MWRNYIFLYEAFLFFSNTRERERERERDVYCEERRKILSTQLCISKSLHCGFYLDGCCWLLCLVLSCFSQKKYAVRYLPVASTAVCLTIQLFFFCFPQYIHSSCFLVLAFVLFACVLLCKNKAVMLMAEGPDDGHDQNSNLCCLQEEEEEREGWNKNRKIWFL